MPHTVLPARITFLIGAHKTASTHLQFSLRDAGKALAAHDIALLMPGDVRRALMPLCYRMAEGEAPDALRAEAVSALAHIFPQMPSHLIVSDENILGGTDRKMLLGPQGLYPWSPGRLSRMLALFGCAADRRIAMAIRGQAGFLASAYCEQLHHMPFMPFADFIAGHEPRALSWAQMIGRLLDAAPGLPFLLWRFEDYPGSFARITSALIGPKAAACVRPLAEAQRVGPSARAISEMAKAAARGKQRAMEGVKKRYPRGPDSPGFDPWSAGERTGLAQLYGKDWAVLGADDRLTLV